MKKIFTISILIIMIGCSNENQSNSKYLRWVGDIKHDVNADDPQFNLCHNENKVKQYFNFSNGLQYKGEKREIVKQFHDKYKAIESNQSGWIRIRFIVNCKGETGRFRLTSSDMNYEELEFDKRITDQVLKITKELKGWIVSPNEEKPEDYYQYLTFKIENGNITEILP